MEKEVVSESLERAVRNAHNGFSNCVKMNNKRSEELLVTKRMRQGCALAITLCKI